MHRGVLLVAKKGPTHTTNDDVDTDTKGNEEARLELSCNQSQSHYKVNCRTLTAMVLIPVRAVTAVLPPIHSKELTTMLVARPKNRKTICAKVPQRVPMISRKVWTLGAFDLSLAASWAKRRNSIVDPAPYHPGSAMAMREKCKMGLKITRRTRSRNSVFIGHCARLEECCRPSERRVYSGVATTVRDNHLRPRRDNSRSDETALDRPGSRAEFWKKS